MSNENGQQPRLTIDDPVPMEVLHRLRTLQEARMDIADRFLTLEQERVRLLAAARRVDEEKQRVFEGILVERGLTPDTTVEIDAGSGKIKLEGKVADATPNPPQQQPPSS